MKSRIWNQMDKHRWGNIVERKSNTDNNRIESRSKYPKRNITQQDSILSNVNQVKVQTEYENKINVWLQKIQL